MKKHRPPRIFPLVSCLFLSCIMMLASACGRSGIPADANAKSSSSAAAVSESTVSETAPAEEPAAEVSSSEPAAEEPLPEETPLPMLNLQNDTFAEVSADVYYPDSPDLTSEETTLREMSALRFKMEPAGWYMDVYLTQRDNNNLNAYMGEEENIAYGERTGFVERTSYAASGELIMGPIDSDKTAMFAFEIRRADDYPLEEGEHDTFLSDPDITFILSSFAAHLPETEAAPEAEAAPEVITDGVAHLNFCEFPIPEGWTPVSVHPHEVKLECDTPYTPEGADYTLTKKLDILSHSMESTVDGEIARLDANFGGGNPIDTVQIGEITWTRMIPTGVDDQFYLVADSGSGTVINADGMFCTVDDEDIRPILESIRIKEPGM